MALIIAAPVAARAEASWVGIWTGDLAHCKLKNKVGESDMAPVRLTVRMFEGYENKCGVDGVKQEAFPRTWSMTMTCSSEGEKTKERRMLIVSQDDADLHIVDETGSVTTFHRCK